MLVAMPPAARGVVAEGRRMRSSAPAVWRCQACHVATTHASNAISTCMAQAPSPFLIVLLLGADDAVVAMLVLRAEPGAGVTAGVHIRGLAPHAARQAGVAIVALLAPAGPATRV